MNDRISIRLATSGGNKLKSQSVSGEQRGGVIVRTGRQPMKSEPTRPDPRITSSSAGISPGKVTQNLGGSQPQGVAAIIGAKLTAMQRLRDGWLGPGSVKPNADALVGYRRLLARVGPDVTLDFEPIAMPDGGIRLEWDTYGVGHVVEILPNGGLYLCKLGDDADEIETELDHFDPERLLKFHGSGS